MLERLVAGTVGIDRDALVEGFEGMWSRVPPLAAGVGRVDRHDYEVLGRLGPLAEKLDRGFAGIEPRVEPLRPGDRDGCRRIAETVEWVGKDLADLNRAIHDQRLAAEMEKAHHLAALDRGFVADLDSHGSALPIVEAIFRLAHGRHLRVVAEGVETDRQRSTPRRVGCDGIRGYLVSPPVEPWRLARLPRAVTPRAAHWSARALQQASA